MGKLCASWLVMTMHGEHSRLVWWVRRLQRLASASLAMTKPWGMASLPLWRASRI